jgi:hypothetical protein
MSFPPVSRGICIAFLLSSVSSSPCGNLPGRVQVESNPGGSPYSAHPGIVIGTLPGMPLTMTSKCRSRCFRVGVHDGFEFALTMTSSWRSPCPGICTCPRRVMSWEPSGSTNRLKSCSEPQVENSTHRGSSARPNRFRITALERSSIFPTIARKTTIATFRRLAWNA